MAKIKSEGLERQDAFLKSIKDADFDFGLVFTQAFLKGIRDIGYKSTATALFESIDNSIQADAGNIHVVFDWDKGKTGKKEPDRIAIIDDGYGMSPEMIRIAVLWGGSDRLDDRKGFGKYGYGLPSSCVSIGQKFTVISKREDGDDWYSVPIDVEDIGNRSPDYIDPKTGRIVAPAAKKTEIPDFAAKYLKKKNVSLEHGTVILIEKIDRLSKSSFQSLKKMLSLETGITYRNYLRKTNIYIGDDIVEPVDPLFTTEGFRFYDENDLIAQAVPSLDISIPSSTNKNIEGTIKVRYSYMPYGFFNPKDEIDNSVEEKEDDNDADELTASGRKAKSKRLTVRKMNNGIIFMRKGRQIDVVDSKCPWTKFQNNDRYIGIEVDFSPELDEDFRITTSKQQVVVSERLWNILRDNGVYSAIFHLRKMYAKQAATVRDNGNLENSTQDEKEKFIEDIMTESANDFEIDSESQPEHAKREGKENLKKKAKKIAQETGLPENVVEQDLEAKTEERPFKLDYIDEEEGPFYRAEQVGAQIVIYLNKAHKFYTTLYNNPQTNGFVKNALTLIIFVLGHSELRVTDEKRKWYKIERNAWSIKLDTTLETLAKHFMKSADDEVFEEEMEENGN